MAFRNYEGIRCLCIERGTPVELADKIDELQETFDLVDLQFSTHFDNMFKESKYCALVLVKSKEN